MRTKLRSRDQRRFRVTATLERSSVVRGGGAQTILLTNIMDSETGERLADHQWFRAGKWSVPLQAGDVISFDARATAYRKGYWGHRNDPMLPVPSVDWRLERPTKVVVTTRNPAVEKAREFRWVDHFPRNPLPPGWSR